MWRKAKLEMLGKTRLLLGGKTPVFKSKVGATDGLRIRS
jgi:hypothetical protein